LVVLPQPSQPGPIPLVVLPQLNQPNQNQPPIRSVVPQQLNRPSQQPTPWMVHRQLNQRTPPTPPQRAGKREARLVPSSEQRLSQFLVPMPPSRQRREKKLEIHRRVKTHRAPSQHQPSRPPIPLGQLRAPSQHPSRPLILLGLPRADQSSTAQPEMDGLFLCAQALWNVGHYPGRKPCPSSFPPPLSPC
jgi:hypothetical protein